MAAIENEKAYAVQLRESSEDGSELGTPNADYRLVFLGEDGQLYSKDSSGVVRGITAPGNSVASKLYLFATCR
jgi:hypothetical protein